MKVHDIKIHVLVFRKVKKGINEIAKIKVVRIWCENNYQEREQTGEAKQYTITILPCFLVPHSIIPVTVIFEAVNEYLSSIINSQNKETSEKEHVSQLKAAFIMYCENSQSFFRYLQRIKERIPNWLFLIMQPILEILGNPTGSVSGSNMSLGDSWYLFYKHFIKYFNPCTKLDNIENQHACYIHTLLCEKNMGLGP